MYGLTVEDWAQMLGAAERGEGPPVDWGLLERHAGVVGPVKRASDEELVRARTVRTEGTRRTVRGEGCTAWMARCA